MGACDERAFCVLLAGYVETEDGRAQEALYILPIDD